MPTTALKSFFFFKKRLHMCSSFSELPFYALSKAVALTTSHTRHKKYYNTYSNQGYMHYYVLLKSLIVTRFFRGCGAGYGFKTQIKNPFKSTYSPIFIEQRYNKAWRVGSRFCYDSYMQQNYVNFDT